MDNHPIPQDITGFQFKLVGNLTIKQFIYLAVGAIFAWVFFFLLHLPFLIKWPLSIISFGAGAMLAFVPVDGRPMDQMIGNFIKAMMSPTEFIYQKSGGKLPQEAAPQATQHQVTQAIQAAPAPITAPINPNIQPQIQAQATPLPAPNPAPQPVITQTPAAPIAQTAPPAMIQVDSPMPQMTPVLGFGDPSLPPRSVIEEFSEPEENKKIKKEKEEAETENLALQGQVVELKKELEAKDSAPQTQTDPNPVPQPQAPIQTQSQIDLEKQLEETKRQREALEKQLLELRAKAETNNMPTFNPVVAKPLEPTQRVRRVPFGMEKSVGLPSIPEAPNLITGIVKDPRGNPIPNILVEVKDQDANPVRAFKTNGLGKFASATSLSNGKYLLSFEDPKEQNKFDAVEIEMQGAPVMPLEIISVDPREELRRELFN